MNDQVKKVKALGEQIGYGHLMNIASALWRQSLKGKGYPEDGAFIATCLSFVDKEIAKETEKGIKLYDRMIRT